MASSDTTGLSPVALVNARAQHSKSYHRPYHLRMARWYDLWRGLYTYRGQPFRNAVHLPYILSIVSSSVSRKVGALFGQFPYVDFMGYAPEDASKARKSAMLVSAQLNDCRTYPKAVDYFTTAELYGTGFARDGWRIDRRNEKFRVLDPQSNSERIVQKTITRFDGPDWENRDPLDVWTQPGRQNIPAMDWLIDRYYLDLDVVEAMTAAGTFDRASFEELKSAPMTGEQEAEMSWRLSVYRSFSEWEARRQEKFAKPIEIWDMWGSVPKEFAPDGITHRLITLGNGRVVMRNRENPFWHKRIPFYSYSPCPDPHYLHGVGKSEICERLQITANKLLNARLDTLDLHGAPSWLVDRNSGIDFQNLYLKPGGIIPVDGPISDDRIKPISPDLRGMEALMVESQNVWLLMQQGSGQIEDTVMGGKPPDRETAHSAVMRQENVANRLMIEVRLAEEEFVEPLANSFMDNNRQFLSLPHQMKIIGSAAIINPVTGLPYPPQDGKVDLEDLNHNYHAHAVGATQMLGKSTKQQNMMMMLQAVSQNPVALKMVNWASYLRQLFQTFDLTNLDELLVQQVPMINQIADQSGQSPQGAAQTMLQPMDQMNPNDLASLLGGSSPAPISFMPPVNAPQMPGG